MEAKQNLIVKFIQQHDTQFFYSVLSVTTGFVKIDN